MLNWFKKNIVVSSLICIGVSVVLLAPLLFAWEQSFFEFEKPLDSSRLGQLGDFIGGIAGSFWALAGVILFYKALVEQRQDFSRNRQSLNLQVKALNSQIEEFRASREEQRLSRKVYEEQCRTAQIQQFDSSFFSLLTVYINIKNKIQESTSFLNIVESISKIDNNSSDVFSVFECWMANYVSSYSVHRELLSRYFRSIYRILKFVDSSHNLTDSDKLHYAKILRAQISDSEAVVLFMNSFTSAGFGTRKDILKYNLLKHMPIQNTPLIRVDGVSLNDPLIIDLFYFLDSFLSTNIPKFYDMNDESMKVEESYHALNLIVGVHFSENINIKIYTSINLHENNISFSDNEFLNIILSYLSYRMVLQKYLHSQSVYFQKSKTDFSDKKCFSFEVITEMNVSLLKDEV